MLRIIKSSISSLFILDLHSKSQLSQHNPQLSLVITPKILTRSIYHISNDILMAFSTRPLAKTCFYFGTLSALLASFILLGPSGRPRRIDSIITSGYSLLCLNNSFIVRCWKRFFDPLKKCFQYSIYHR